MPPASVVAAMAEDAAAAGGSVGAAEGGEGAPGVQQHTQETLTMKFAQYDEKMQEMADLNGLFRKMIEEMAGRLGEVSSKVIAIQDEEKSGTGGTVRQ